MEWNCGRKEGRLAVADLAQNINYNIIIDIHECHIISSKKYHRNNFNTKLKLQIY